MIQLSGMKNKIFFSFVFFVALLFFGKIANAASLNFSPSSGTHHVGDIFSVKVYVKSTDQAMNAVEGKVLFPVNLLQVVSVSDGSVIAIPTPNEPAFSNVNGTVNFGGINMNSSYKGSKGKVLIINFKAEATGTAKLSITNGSVLANDGQGTEIISTTGNAKFKLIKALSVVNKVTPLADSETVEPVQPTTNLIAEPVQSTNEQTVSAIDSASTSGKKQSSQSYFNIVNATLLGSHLLFILLLLILLIFVIVFWFKYYKLRHIVDQAILEEQKEQNRLFKILNMDIAEKEKVMEKLRTQKKLNDNELKIIMEIEKKYEGRN